MADENSQITQESQPEAPKEPEKCPECEMIVPNLLMMATARAACEYIDDQGKKGECINWAEHIDPDKIKNAKDICKDVWRKSGVKGFEGISNAWNNTMREALIEGVDEMYARGETPDEDSRRLYAIFTKKKVI